MKNVKTISRRPMTCLVWVRTVQIKYFATLHFPLNIKNIYTCSYYKLVPITRCVIHCSSQYVMIITQFEGRMPLRTKQQERIPAPAGLSIICWILKLLLYQNLSLQTISNCILYPFNIKIIDTIRNEMLDSA